MLVRKCFLHHKGVGLGLAGCQSDTVKKKKGELQCNVTGTDQAQPQKMGERIVRGSYQKS